MYNTLRWKSLLPWDNFGKIHRDDIFELSAVVALYRFIALSVASGLCGKEGTALLLDIRALFL